MLRLPNRLPQPDLYGDDKTDTSRTFCRGWDDPPAGLADRNRRSDTFSLGGYWSVFPRIFTMLWWLAPIARYWLQSPFPIRALSCKIATPASAKPSRKRFVHFVTRSCGQKPTHTIHHVAQRRRPKLQRRSDRNPARLLRQRPRNLPASGWQRPHAPPSPDKAGGACRKQRDHARFGCVRAAAARRSR